ncbi:MAG TPA: AMP-binding protein, partial [Dongiaceae bacterium]|nr:AMP-binding protein [Dongiaceae bacterium]
GFLAAFASGAHINYLNSILPNEIKDALKQRGVTHMIVVPLLMDMIRKGIERNFTARFGERGALLLRTLQQVSNLATVRPLRRLLNGFILSELGPKLNTLIVGGATLDPSTLAFFENLGVHAWQGYGLTETSPVAAVNSPGQIKRGSVGRPMPGCAIRVDATPGEQIGEILIQGPCIMNGYYKDRAYTREAIDAQDWFHTGDLGYMSDDGYLHITGRKKNLIVLDGGKKVYPEEVEKALSASLMFQELCVTGLKVPHPSLPGKLTEQVSAVIVPQTQLREANNLAELQTLCEQEVQRLCRELSSYKRPVQVIVQLDELPKTRTGKVKAPLVQQKLSVSYS